MKRTQQKISPQLTEPENRHNCKYQKPSRDECVIFQHAESKSYSEPIYIYICTRKKNTLTPKTLVLSFDIFSKLTFRILDIVDLFKGRLTSIIKRIISAKSLSAIHSRVIERVTL